LTARRKALGYLAQNLYQVTMANSLLDLNVYLINLPERKDRLTLAERELARLGWHIGPCGVTLFSASRFSERGGFPSSSIRGAFHSHTECLKAGLRRGVRDVLLLEDDIAFASCLPRLMPSLRSDLAKKSWDFCYLGHEDTGSIDRAHSHTHHVNLVPYANPIIGLHFCMVNRRVLPRLIDHLDRVALGHEGDDDYGPMPIDGAFNTFRRLNSEITTLVADPKLGWQRPSRSDITPRFFDRSKFLRPAVNALRNIKNAADRWRS
jgi:glycosyl transferase, family 25